MKKIIGIVAGCLAVLTGLVSCEHKGALPESTGGVYEVFVVSPRAVWESKVGDTLRAVLLEPVRMINQREPVMDMVPMLPTSMSGLAARHRNIVQIEIGEKYAEPSIKAVYDTYSKPQIIVYITGPSDSAVTDYIWAQRENLRQVFEIAERDRYVAAIQRTTDKVINEKIKQMFGFDMTIPRGYKVNNTLDNFLWISYEWPTASQGIIIYSYPYTGKSDFSLDSLVSKRNQFVKNIEGERKDTYMKTSDVEPDVEYMRINDRPWAEMQGFWDLSGDYMGGPFRSYTTLDSLNNRMVCIDEYVFAPSNKKRNLIRQLESLIYTVRFPSDKK